MNIVDKVSGVDDDLRKSGSPAQATGDASASKRRVTFSQADFSEKAEGEAGEGAACARVGGDVGHRCVREDGGVDVQREPADERAERARRRARRSAVWGVQPDGL